MTADSQTRQAADAALRAVPWLFATDRAAILDAIEAAGLVVTAAVEPEQSACQTQRRETWRGDRT